jgi:hypothetical protein
MYPYGFRNNLAVFINHFSGSFTLTLEALSCRIQALNENRDFQYYRDTLADDNLRKLILERIFKTGPVPFLDEMLYHRIDDEELVELLDRLRKLSIAVCKKTLLNQGKYLFAWKLNSVRQTYLLGNHVSMEAKYVIESILLKLRHYPLSGFKLYLKKIV